MNASRPLKRARGRQTGSRLLTAYPNRAPFGPTRAAIQRSVGAVANVPPSDTGLTSVRSSVTASRLRLHRLNTTKLPDSRTGQRSLLRLADTGVGESAPGRHAQIWVARLAWSRPRSGMRLDANASPFGPRSVGST